MPEAVIVATGRTPIGRANKGSLVECRPDDLTALVLKTVLAKVPQLKPTDIEDVLLGCGQPAGEAGYNIARVAAIMAGLDNVPARFILIPGIFAIEVISQFVRVISLSVRLFANILAGHLLILFMGGGLVVLLGIAALGVVTLPIAVIFFLFEVVLIATLQAFIFATLTAIYLGGAVAESH